VRSSGRLLLGAVAFAALALQPAVALATPSPAPALSGVLIQPPSAGFVELDSTVPGVVEGQFDANSFAKVNTSNPSGVEKTLARDGFVDGYGRTWVQQATRHVLIEIVVAFSGGDGARRWLTSSEVADKADPGYQHSISVSGIGSYYGERYANATTGVYEDVFAFVKGNDFFIVGVGTVSATDDLGNAAADQTKAQYAAAPDATIPKSQWPQSSTSSAFEAGAMVFKIVIGVVVIAVVVLVIVLARRRGGVVSGVMPAVAGFQMSPDGAHWWDGQQWRDAKTDIPTQAQRTADGQFWWDGQQWRPVA